MPGKVFGFTLPAQRLDGFGPFGKEKTSDFFEVKFRCFALKVRRFASKKSDVLHFRSLLFKKSFLIFSYIPAPIHENPIYTLGISGEG